MQQDAWFAFLADIDERINKQKVSSVRGREIFVLDDDDACHQVPWPASFMLSVKLIRSMRIAVLPFQLSSKNKTNLPSNSARWAGRHLSWHGAAELTGAHGFGGTARDHQQKGVHGVPLFFLVLWLSDVIGIPMALLGMPGKEKDQKVRHHVCFKGCLSDASDLHTLARVPSQPAVPSS